MRLFLIMLAVLLTGTSVTSLAHAQGKKNRELGELGRVTVEKAVIRSAPATTGRILIEAPRNTYLALTKRKGQYYGVQMADGSVGYIASKDMEVLDYTVVTAGPERGKGDDSSNQEITRRFPSPNGKVECYTTFGKDGMGTRLFLRRKGSKDQGKLLLENDRWMKVHWSPTSRIFAVEDHWDGHVSDVYVYAVTLSGKDGSAQRVAHSPALRTYDVKWEVERWDTKNRRLIIRDSFDPRRKRFTLPLPSPIHQK